MPNPVVDKVLRKIGDPQLVERLTSLPPTELQSLLLELYRVSALGITAPDLLGAYASNRFVSPSELNPVLLHQAQVDLLELARDHRFETIQLSPLAPMGTCSVVGLADQNKVVSAGRGTEVVADATNFLALETSVRRKASGFDHSILHLCACHRHVRAQAIPKIKGFTSHFAVFCAVSAGRDAGSGQFEQSALLAHLQLYQDYLVGKLKLRNVSVVIKGIASNGSDVTVARQVFTEIENQLRGISLSFERVPEDEHRYYRHIRFSLNVDFQGRNINLGDGGFVDWAAKLTSQGKERMLTSGIGLELLLKLQHGLI